MKLLDLTEAAKVAFRKGKMLLGHAFELARLQENEQQRALKWMLERGKDVQTPCGWKRIHLMPRVPELKLWIRENVFLDLTKAPLGTGDSTLHRMLRAFTAWQVRA